MKHVYATKSTGHYHTLAQKPCQDSYGIEKNDAGYIILAVADGVGSCEKADVASKAATDASCEYCRNNLKEKMDDSEVLDVIHDSFLVAEATVRKVAEQEQNAPEEYETTLCLAVIRDDQLYYGQSGDSGMVALLQDGHYITVTEQQRDELGYVFPLSFGEPFWVFNKQEQPISAVMLMTDGIWENVVPPILEGRDICVNVPMLELVMNHFEDNEEELNNLEAEMNEYWENFPIDYLNDDKTTVVYFNTDQKPARLEESYYEIPDWNAILKEHTDTNI